MSDRRVPLHIAVAQQATISVEEAGAMVGLSRSGAYKAAKAGRLPVVRIGRAVRVSAARMQAIVGAAENGPQPIELEHDAHTRSLWEAYAVARQIADDSLLSMHGLAAAQAFYEFLAAFRTQAESPDFVAEAVMRRAARVPN